MTASQRDDLPPRVLQLVGLVGMIACFCFWAATDRLEPAIFTGFGALTAYGQVQVARRRLRNNGNGTDGSSGGG